MIKRWSAMLMAVVLLTGCGYRFPGEAPLYPAWVHDASLQVKDYDAWENPSLAKHLDYRLRQRLEIQPGAAGQREIQVTLQPRKDTVLTVQTSGRAMRHEVALRAEVQIREGDKAVGPPLAVAEGRALFSEAPGSSPLQSRVGREDAEAEALERLVETITAVLAGLP